MIPKADAADYAGRFREIVSDPLGVLIERHPQAGLVDGQFVHLHNGLRVPVAGPGSYYGPFSTILVINRGVHEPLEEFVFQELLKALPAAPTMLELGAYWSHYSMWLKLRRPDAQVVMVEPEPQNLACGRANFALNGFAREFVEARVGHGAFEVDRFLMDRALEGLDILHSDIQGFELEMLDGARRTLSEHRAASVFVSTHSQALHTSVIERLAAHGYRVEVSADFDHQTTAYDGFVFASSPRVEPLFTGFRPLGREQICAASSQELAEYVASASARRHSSR